MSSLHDRLRRSGPKKLLAIDGGGIRGVIALEVLLEIEKILGGGSPGFRLAHYFDYISGTSTGAIIASGLSLGMSVQELLDFYQTKGPQMFDHASLLRRFRQKFDDRNLAQMLQEVMGATTTLGSDRLQTLLMVVLRNATTDSPWPVSNNPYAKYNDKDRPDCNLELPLWQLVRASTAAPTYFPPEVVRIGPQEFVFVDGGVTMYNNPAFLTFLMATTQAYWPNREKLGPGDLAWPAATGVDQLLLVSVGTGSAANANEGLLPGEMNLVYNASTIPSALMFAASNEQDMLCRIFGDCLVGDDLDREIGNLIGEGSRGALKEKLFTYVRYNADLSSSGLAALGLGHLDPVTVQKMDFDRRHERDARGRPRDCPTEDTGGASCGLPRGIVKEIAHGTGDGTRGTTDRRGRCRHAPFPPRQCGDRS